MQSGWVYSPWRAKVARCAVALNANATASRSGTLSCLETAPCVSLHLNGAADAESYLTLVVPPQAATLSISDDCDFWEGYFRDGGTVKELMSR
jgi:hypothetical protein